MHIVTVNRYIVTMTSWQPNLEGRDGPRYVAIAEALAEDIDQGRVKAGHRLPTHRDLAWRLGVTVGTVTRAYAEAERRGLVAGEVGRGTFVKESVPIGPETPDDAAGDDFVDLSYNYPPDHPRIDTVGEVLGEITAEGALAGLMGYEMGLGRMRHRAAGARWLSEGGLPSEAEDVVVTAGAQHGMLLAVSALARPGDTVLTEQLTYYGIKSIAAVMDLRLHGLPMDREGLLPDTLDAACRATGAKVLYTIPTLQNPTTAIMSEARRREVAEVCERHGVSIVEDDVYGFLPEPAPPPLARIAPERTIHVAGLSKCLAPGLRIGFLRADRALLDRVGTAMRASTLMAPPLLAEVASRLIGDGRARKMAEWQRKEARARQEIAARILPAELTETQPEAFQLWLRLPEPWRREVFAAEARSRGVGVAPAEVFAIGRQPVPHAVRVCLQAARRRGQLERALTILAELLAGRPQSPLAMV